MDHEKPMESNMESKPENTGDSPSPPPRYMTNGGKEWFFSTETLDKLPQGFYRIKYSQDRGVYAKSSKIRTKDLIELPGMPNKKIIREINKFWNSEDAFNRYGIVHKRSILLHGHPGCGKSCIVSLLIGSVVDSDGICVEFDDVDSYLSWIKSFREIEPERPLLVVIEDIDVLIKDHGEKWLSSIFDEPSQNRVVYLAVTSNIKSLNDGLRKRSSKFDQIIEVGLPSDEDRGAYLDAKISDNDKEEIKYDKRRWVNDTKNMTLSHLRELMISVVVLGNDYKETIEGLKNTKISPSSKGIGFGRE